jgi:hypothetical protein
MTHRIFDPTPRITHRPIAELATDLSALRAIAQAAINVELFTIPLYMGTLYSIQGMHEINAAGQTFYKGRLWPGAATSRAPKTANERAFNVIFSVFIQEMLHLQLAANLAACIGVQPDFTSPALQDKSHGWTCYGPEEHVIPHVLDLRDTTTYADLAVDVAPLDEKQIRLFKAIEEPERDAVAHIEPEKLSRYFPQVPFAGWEPGMEEGNLPLFGTIGFMYRCMAEYMLITYDDGTSLWRHAFQSNALQRELFNTPSGGHPMAEYPGFPTVVPTSDPAEALRSAIDMMLAITDQGEGGGESLRAAIRSYRAATAHGDNDVKPVYRSSEKALKLDYPSYDADGKPAPSADAAARHGADCEDHYARFKSLEEEIGAVVTWGAWHRQHGPWTAADLLTGATPPPSRIPSADDVAGALNRLAEKDGDGSVYRQLSQVAAGSLYGVTRVLNDFWRDPSAGFPFPAMGGTGDRMAICWAVLGRGPSLRGGIDPAPPAPYHHACQGLDLTHPGADVMPANATFHTCIGSNQCKGQGGCGFVQTLAGGGSCGHSAGAGGSASGGKTIGAHLAAQGTSGALTTLYSPPADNACGGFGGCAVPISASQLYPKSGVMQLFDIVADNNPKVGEIVFKVGDPVYDTAWAAYLEVLKARHVEPLPPQPPTDDLRLAFPPST